MNICIIDNFDSFTFNLREEFCRFENSIHIWRNSMSVDEICRRIDGLKGPKLIVLSPGPGHPDNSGSMIPLIKKVQGNHPIFGVCLGMQAIVRAFDGEVSRVGEIVHGKARVLEHEGDSIFTGMSNRILVGRYHSLSAQKISDQLQVIAHSDNEIMAVRHKKFPIIGIQFHPESILTTEGSHMIENVLRWAGDFGERIQ